jgi:formylglycine-generating enzyme required for sulfatase activity
VEVVGGEKRLVEWDMQKAMRVLRVVTEPSGAEISVNGVVKGKSPVDVKDIKPGTAKVRASMNTKEFAVREEQVNIEAGREPKVLEWTLTQLVGSLRVRVRPVEASIYVENELKGTGGVELAGIGAGTIRVKTVLEGYVPQEKRVEIVPGREMSLEMDLSPAGPKIGDMWKDPVTGMVFMWVPGGYYQMGCGSWDGNCQSDEKLHEVCVDGFWMGQTEVTQGQWQRVIPGSNPSNFKKGDNYPVEQVSWEDVKEYIRKLNGMGNVKFRLPSEAEWEYAARSGGKAEKYSGGSDLDGVAWYSSNSGSSTHPVRTKKSNGLGIYDMSGNVWEWCEDVYIADIYSRSDKKNPIYNSGGPRRVGRGGSWGNGPDYVRCAYRDGSDPAFRYFSLGFRLLRMP